VRPSRKNSGRRDASIFSPNSYDITRLRFPGTSKPPVRVSSSHRAARSRSGRAFTLDGTHERQARNLSHCKDRPREKLASGTDSQCQRPSPSQSDAGHERGSAKAKGRPGNSRVREFEANAARENWARRENLTRHTARLDAFAASPGAPGENVTPDPRAARRRLYPALPRAK
jgi:hypothetical protein